jgi:hypothetical protein
MTKLDDDLVRMVVERIQDLPTIRKCDDCKNYEVCEQEKLYCLPLLKDILEGA